MSDLNIPVSLRTNRGKKNKALRKSQSIPAVVYGGDRKNLSFSLDIRLAEKFSKKEYENKIFTFNSKDKDLNGIKAIKKSTHYHKASRLPIHMDFFSLDMKKVIRVQVDILYKGVPKGVKEEGGVLNTVLRQVEIECLPSEIPPSIEMDVSNLNLNDNLHVSDIKLDEKLRMITPQTRTLCTVVQAKEEEEKKPGEEAAPVAAEGATTTPEAGDAKAGDAKKEELKKKIRNKYLKNESHCWFRKSRSKIPTHSSQLRFYSH